MQFKIRTDTYVAIRKGDAVVEGTADQGYSEGR